MQREFFAFMCFFYNSSLTHPVNICFPLVSTDAHALPPPIMIILSEFSRQTQKYLALDSWIWTSRCIFLRQVCTG